MRSLRPGVSLRGTTQTSEPVSFRNLSLLTRSVTNSRPEGVEQASVAINACRCRFSAGGRSTMVYIFLPCPRIAASTYSNRTPLGHRLGKERRSPYACLWNDSAVGCSHRLGLRLDGIDPLSCGAGPLRRGPGRWMLWWEAERLPRSGRPFFRRRPGCPRLG